MPDYRRNRVPGGTFFTVNLRDPHSDLLVTQIDISRDAVRRVRARTPFRIVRAATILSPRRKPV
jgi:putative transposase